jgi:hypothetical protein
VYLQPPKGGFFIFMNSEGYKPNKNVVKALKEPAFGPIIEEVVQFAEEAPINYEEVLVRFPSEYMLAVVLGGIVFDNSDRIRTNGVILSENAVRHLEDCGIPLRRSDEIPGERLGRATSDDVFVWQSEHIVNGNEQDSISGEKITQVRRKKPRKELIRKESIQLG